jgi:hypothetical protein
LEKAPNGTATPGGLNASAIMVSLSNEFPRQHNLYLDVRAP